MHHYSRLYPRRVPLCLVLCLITCALLGACVPAGTKPTAPLPRANPGYVQWLERQSMLAATPTYSRLVSGTELLWRLPAADNSENRIAILLEAADTWLFVYPPSLLTEGQRTVMAELHTGTTLRQLKMLGFGGIYAAPTAESSALWTGQTGMPGAAAGESSGDSSGDSLSTESYAEDATSLGFAPHMGTEKQYIDLAKAAGREQMQLGAGLVPAAVGIGPDFLLAGRHVRDYPGSLIMVEVPKEYWHLLPPAPALTKPTGITTASSSLSASNASPMRSAKTAASPTSPPPVSKQEESPYAPRTWTATALRGPHQAALDALVAKNIVPAALVRDSLPWATPSGWAATPLMEGIDGVERRFVYRYHGNVNSPVLQWDDPSRNAQRILSASTIRTIGSQQQTLGGLYPEAWAGLDVAPVSNSKAVGSTVPEPAAAALRDLSREIRRYGGWSMQADVFPPSLTSAILSTGVDFTLDTITSPTAEYALLTGDTQPLKEALKASLNAGVDHRRLVRTLPHYKGLDLRPLYDTNNTHARSAATKLHAWLRTDSAKAWLGPPEATQQPERINATAATLAAMAAGFGPAEAIRPENATAIQSRHMLLTALRASLPGLLLLSGADITGALNVPVARSTKDGASVAKGTSPLGGWGFSSAAQAGIVTRTGLARAPSVYGAIQAQAAQPNSYGQQLADVVAKRRQWGLARAQLVALPNTSHTSTVAILLLLGDGSHSLTVANFSAQARSENIRISAGKHGQKGQDIQLELDPWQCRLIHIPYYVGSFSVRFLTC